MLVRDVLVIDYVMATIEWVVVPAIFLLALAFSLFEVADPEAEPAVKASARAGVWGGLVLLFTYVITRNPADLSFNFELHAYPLQISTVAAAAGVAFLACFVLDRFRRSRLAGLVGLALFGSTSIGLFSYLFIRSLRHDLVFMALGVAFGCLLREIVHPMWRSPSRIPGQSPMS